MDDEIRELTDRDFARGSSSPGFRVFPFLEALPHRTADAQFIAAGGTHARCRMVAHVPVTSLLLLYITRTCCFPGVTFKAML